jgi:lipoate-protein ligase B
MAAGAYLLDLAVTPYGEAWALQRSLAAAVGQGAIPDTVVVLEHPPTVTLGRRTDESELHLPEGAEVDVVETNRGGRSTYHAPGQLVVYPILDLNRHGRDVRRYCRDLEQVAIDTLAAFGVPGVRREGLTGVWTGEPPRKIASLGIHLARWISTHGLALNVDLDPSPFTEWITACGLEDEQFTTLARELGHGIEVDEVRTALIGAVAAVFDLQLERLPPVDGAGLWPQPRHKRIGGESGGAVAAGRA